MRAITRVATRETETTLLAIAGRSSAAQLESLVQTYERVDGDAGPRVRSEERRGLSWRYEDGMLVVTAAVPAERGALLIKALEKIVDARADEREAHYQSLLEEDCGAVAVAPDADPIAEPTVPGPVANDSANGSGEVASAGDGQNRDDAAVTRPIVLADGLRDVSAETECATANVAGYLPAEADDLPASLVFELSNTRQRYADALVDVAEHYLANGPSHRERRTGQRYEVVLTIGRNELAKQASAGGARYHVDPDWGIDEEDARQIACDADFTEFI